jgi:hypothetical protein
MIEWIKRRTAHESKLLCYGGKVKQLWRSSMHNLVSYNQLAGWKGRVAEIEERTHESAINDYFQCLTECDDNAAMCRRICKEVLV